MLEEAAFFFSASRARKRNQKKAINTTSNGTATAVDRIVNKDMRGYRDKVNVRVCRESPKTRELKRGIP